jgi:hypothetical protein
MLKVGYNVQMKRRLILLIWLAGILFPIAWLGSFWPAYRRVFAAIFSPEWVHVVMHAMLFAVLAALLLQLLFPRFGFKSLILVLLIGLAVGMFQEGFQALSLESGSLHAAIFDLGVDLSGILVGSMGFNALRFISFTRSS